MSNEELSNSPLANLLVAIMELVVSILMIPFYLIIGAASLVSGVLIIFIIGLLLAAIAIICSLTVVVL